MLLTQFGFGIFRNKSSASPQGLPVLPELR